MRITLELPQRPLRGVDGVLRLPLRPRREQRPDDDRRGDAQPQRAEHRRGQAPAQLGTAKRRLRALAAAAIEGAGGRDGKRSVRGEEILSAPAPLPSSLALSGPRPASQPAQSSATHALPGTYHVQSTSEWMPKTTTRQSMLSSPTRSGVYGAGRPASVSRRHAG